MVDVYLLVFLEAEYWSMINAVCSAIIAISLVVALVKRDAVSKFNIGNISYRFATIIIAIATMMNISGAITDPWSVDPSEVLLNLGLAGWFFTYSTRYWFRGNHRMTGRK